MFVCHDRVSMGSRTSGKRSRRRGIQAGSLSFEQSCSLTLPPDSTRSRTIDLERDQTVLGGLRYHLALPPAMVELEERRSEEGDLKVRRPTKRCCCPKRWTQSSELGTSILMRRLALRVVPWLY